MCTQGESYIVQENDTFESVALQFDISVDWLRQSNNRWGDEISPGDVLVIKPKLKEEDQMIPINVELVTDITTHGQVTLAGESIRFESSRLKAPVVIKLADITRTSLVDHTLSRNTSLKFSCVNEHSEVNNYEIQGSVIPVHQFHERLLQRMEEIEQKREQEQRDLLLNQPPATRREPSWNEPLPITISGTSNILKAAEIFELRKHFPYRFRNSNWRRLYQLSTDGASYQIFFRRTERIAPVVMMIMSDKGEKIGCFVSSGIFVSRKYYGSGETFVFRLQPTLEVFKWSHLNDYFTCSTADEIAIGGGGASAIWIGGNLLNAYSEPCPTFKSPALTKEMNFKIANLEVWKMEN